MLVLFNDWELLLSVKWTYFPRNVLQIGKFFSYALVRLMRERHCDYRIQIVPQVCHMRMQLKPTVHGNSKATMQLLMMQSASFRIVDGRACVLSGNPLSICLWPKYWRNANLILFPPALSKSFSFLAGSLVVEWLFVFFLCHGFVGIYPQFSNVILEFLFGAFSALFSPPLLCIFGMPHWWRILGLLFFRQFWGSGVWVV